MGKKAGKELQKQFKFCGDATENYRLVGSLEKDNPPLYRLDIFRDFVANNPSTEASGSMTFSGVMAHAFVENDAFFETYCKFLKKIILEHTLDFE
jgi:hypothetical protein